VCDAANKILSLDSESSRDCNSTSDVSTGEERYSCNSHEPEPLRIGRGWVCKEVQGRLVSVGGWGWPECRALAFLDGTWVLCCGYCRALC
jgi:hypothetical protein